MDMFAFRLKPGQDLRNELESFALSNNVPAGVIITCVGSLKIAVLRLADGKSIKYFNGPLEIVSLVGTISDKGAHLHMSISDSLGNVFGGHVKEGCIGNDRDCIGKTPVDHHGGKEHGGLCQGAAGGDAELLACTAP